MRCSLLRAAMTLLARGHERSRDGAPLMNTYTTTQNGKWKPHGIRISWQIWWDRLASMYQCIRKIFFDYWICFNDNPSFCNFAVKICEICTFNQNHYNVCIFCKWTLIERTSCWSDTLFGCITGRGRGCRGRAWLLSCGFRTGLRLSGGWRLTRTATCCNWGTFLSGDLLSFSWAWDMQLIKQVR